MFLTYLKTPLYVYILDTYMGVNNETIILSWCVQAIVWAFRGNVNFWESLDGARGPTNWQ